MKLIRYCSACCRGVEEKKNLCLADIIKIFKLLSAYDRRVVYNR